MSAPTPAQAAREPRIRAHRFNVPMPTPEFTAATRRATARRHDALVADVVRLRADAGLTCELLARSAGIDPAYLRRIEARLEPVPPGESRRDPSPSLETYQRLATVLGADLATRLYPNTGPLVRDRLQGRILEVLLADRHPRWTPFTELAVRRPSRGWIDVALHDPREHVLIAGEIQSELNRIEQLVRWSAAKAESLPSWEGWPHLGDEPAVSRLLIVRRTRTTRSVALEFERQLRVSYPAHPGDALAALRGSAPWPGPAMVWAIVEGTRTRLVATR